MDFDGTAIAHATRGQRLSDGPAGPVLTDTRALGPGAWFLALQGDRFDGHDFLRRAAEAGAAGCIVSRPPPSDWEGGAVLVSDTTRALQDLGRAARARLSAPVVGLTGSSGKTTTRSLIALAISSLGRIHQTVGNLNNHLGVPMTLLSADSDADGLVVEMGTSSHGEIAVLCDIAAPTVRLVLNVGPAHLLELGGLEGVAREKGQLFATARPGDTVIANLDDPFVTAFPIPDGAHRITYGRHRAADVRLTEVEVSRSDLLTRATWDTPDGRLSATLPAPGAHIAHNAAGALACAMALGIDLRDAVPALEQYEPVGMRLRAEPLVPGATALNDAYNANPQSVEASLRVLAELSGRRVAVLGDMLELGGHEARWHNETVELADSLGLDLLVLVGPRMSAAASVVTQTEVWQAEDGLTLVDALRDWLQPGDLALFKGSRGARVEQILHAIRDGVN